MTDGPVADALRTAVGAATIPAGDDGSSPRLVAVGWVTIELDRAVADLAEALGTNEGAFRPAPDSRILGAFCRVAVGLLDGGVHLAVVEPSTEGRLAGHLARHGEGPTVAWLAGPHDPAGLAPAGSDGPFGPERVLPSGRDGRLRLLVAAPPGTIRP